MSSAGNSWRGWLSRPRRFFVASSLACAAVWMASLFLVTLVEAKTSFDSPYTLAQTYQAALRHVRVDLGLTVTERDATAAYILFDYKNPESGARVVPGSIEMLDSGRAVRIVIQLGQMPRYHEQVIADGLARKLRDEYGEPVPREPKRDSPDAGTDSALFHEL